MVDDLLVKKTCSCHCWWETCRQKLKVK